MTAVAERQSQIGYFEKQKPEPLPFQLKSIDMNERNDGRSLISLEMGLGKTLVSLWTLERNPDWLPALVICPACLKYNWEYETHRTIGVRTSVCEGQKPGSLSSEGFRVDPPITIINYEILHHWLPYLKQCNFKTVIVDEGHYCSNPKAKRTKAVRKVARECEHVMVLSGTPLVNRPIELFPVINMIWPEKFKNFWEFTRRYCNPKLTPWGWDLNGASNLPELNHKLVKSGMIRFRKDEVLGDLPSKFRRIVPCQLSDPDEYVYASSNFMSWIRQNYRGRSRNTKKAEALVRIGYLLRLAARLKMKYVVDQVNEFLKLTDEKIILFAVHKKAIDVLYRRVNAESVVIDGSISGRKRQARIDQFQKDKNTRVFIGQHQASGVGLNLTAASRAGIVEFGWRPGDHAQLEDRLHRIGQKNKVFIDYFTAIGTIEEKVCKILQSKQEVTSAVLDGGQTPQDLNIGDELLRILEQESNYD